MADNIEIDQEVVDAVAQKAAEQVAKSIVVPTADEIVEKLAAAQEATVKKNIHDSTVEKTEKKDVTNSFADMSKEMRLAKAMRASALKDYATLREYNAFSAKQWAEKSDYQNVTTAADGGALVPDPEFIAEVERLTDEYGVASRLANVRKTDRDSVTLLSGTNEVSFTKTGEATAKNAQKLTYAAATVTLDKYILTIPVTSELVEDAAINIWADVANEVARARAKLFDQLVFTDSTYGLLSAANGDAYKTHTVGSAITDLDADDLMDGRYKVVSSARRNGRYFLHPTVWNFLRQTKSGDGTNSAANYLFGGPGQNVTPNVDGVPVELVDVLPEKGDITANEAFGVFGDLSRVNIHVKRVLETKIFDAGVVPDAGGSDINLISQDAYAMRATLRCVPQTRFEGAFVIFGTGTVS